MEFRAFIEVTQECQKDINDTLKKIPKVHAALVKGYKYKFEPNNTLDGDHVGEIDSSKKTIRVAAPWNYGRQYAFLHEIAHQVWDNIVDDDRKKTWQGIVKKTKHKQNQSAEELFCMAYADFYAKNKIEIHLHPTWAKFIKSLPK